MSHEGGLTNQQQNNDPQKGQVGGRFRFSFRQKKKKEDKRNDTEADKHPKYLSQEEAQEIDNDLLTEYCFSADQLIELGGLGCAVAISKVYPKDTLTKYDGSILLCCGPGNNGAQGLVCARHLKLFGFRPTVFYPRTPSKTIYKNLVNQCEKMDIPFLSYMPSDTHLLDSSYNIMVDAVFGINFLPPVRPELVDVMQRLRQVKIPIVSIDVPSGWHIENGDPDGIQPDTLVSLICPKRCAKLFHGRHHFLGGRFVPPSLVAKYELDLPPFPGTDACVELPLVHVENEAPVE